MELINEKINAKIHLITGRREVNEANEKGRRKFGKMRRKKYRERIGRFKQQTEGP